MYIVTNRSIDEGKSGLGIFGKRPSEKGSRELRLVAVARKGTGFRTTQLDDQLPVDTVRSLKEQFRLDLDESAPWYASLEVACQLMARARKEKKHILLFVHGYNNDVGDVMRCAMELEEVYNLIVVPFTWPANGGGLPGTASYLSDKSDARLSAEAFARVVGKIGYYHDLLTQARREELMAEAARKHPDNHDARRSLFTRLLEKDCRITINLMCHSMGNYLLKYAIRPSGSAVRQLVFDNVCLVAADANNPGHEAWVRDIQVRNRLYVFINENDFALKWSRRKPGEAQLARLGHYLRNLAAPNARYVNVTPAKAVSNRHDYFRPETVNANAQLKAVFADAFQGRSADDRLAWVEADGAYVIR